MAIEWDGVNPYYTCYCRAHGADSVNQMRLIEREWLPKSERPMFTSWIQDKWGKWRKEIGISPHTPITDERRKDFETWLTMRIESGLKSIDNDIQ